MRKTQVEVTFFESLTFTVDLAIADADPDVGADESIDDWSLVEVEGSKEPKVLEFFTNLLGNPDFQDDWLETCWDEV